MGFFNNLFRQKQDENPLASNMYSSLTYRQKMAAMNLMKLFGGSCSGSQQELSKINQIMSVEGNKMNVSASEVNAIQNQFSDLDEMIITLKNADRNALKSLFWTFYCIIGVGKSEQAVQLLISIYNDFGFTTQECATILEQKTGVNIRSL